MIFLQPEYLKLFFLPLALLPLWFYSLSVKRKTRLSLGQRELLRRVSRLSPLWRDALRFLLLHLVLACLILALAHPQRVREKMVPYPGRLDVVFLLDISPSMRAADVPPSRLARALEVIGKFAQKKYPHDRVGLVSFAGGSLILSYLTEDPEAILYYLDYLRRDETLSFGTNIGRALRNGLEILARDPAGARDATARRAFVLISDGEDHGGELEAAVREVKRWGIRVHTIGIGSKEGAPIPVKGENGAPAYLEDERGQTIITRFDERTLALVAEETGGSAYRTYAGQELESLFQTIVLKERGIEGFRKVIEYHDAYYEFLVGAFAFFAAMLLI